VDSHVIGLSADGAADQRIRWPVRSGAVPALADNYCLRPETGIGAAGSVLPGEIMVLADAGQDDAGRTDRTGGTGKTQLAAAAAQELLRSRAVDLLIWIGASSRDAVLAGYAQALADLSIAEVADSLEAAAAPMMLEWLASTSRPWLVVLDDLADHHDLDGLWPQRADSRVMVTTRGSGAMPGGQSVRLRPVGPLSHREAVNYLTAALKHDPDLRLGAPDLAEELECLPIGLACAIAVMADRRLDCRDYRALLAERKQLLSSAWGGACPLNVLATWSLAVDRATEFIPGGFVWRILALTAMLDPEGIPATVLMSQAACSYFTDRPGAALAENQAQVRSAVSVLARLGLLTVDGISSTRAVRMHAQIQRAVRSYVSAEHRHRAGLAAADALIQAWPAEEVHPALAQALRDCTHRLRDATGSLLWEPGCHPILVKAADSLDSAGLTRSAVTYWEGMLSANTQLLGSSHPDTMLANSRLANSYERAGQPASAIGLYERALADTVEALGPGHSDSLAALSKLASAYLAAGRTADAIGLHKRTLADRERAQGPRHPDTITARGRLADCYRAAGQLKEAIDAYERTLADRERAQGGRHLDTIAARANLAFAYRTAGRMRDAIPAYLRTLADREQVQGPHHPDTLTARGNLAAAYHSARRVKDAIPVYERTLADWERVRGPHHPQTLTARGNLASAYHSARRLADAIPLYERTIADCEAVLGQAHPDTLTLRSNLGHAYHTAGRLTDAIAIFQLTLADSEQALGPDHPLTKTARENLDAVTQE
jgi:tetratricopeptide (TPR) repeat protein